MDHAETRMFGMNDSGTCKTIDTPLTQARSQDVHGWQSINTAPKNAWILIADDHCWPPDLVRWQPERKERWVNGNRYLPVPEGWFGSPGGRSRFDVPDGHLMKATRWMALPNRSGTRAGE
jgi:hypothetical protein